MTEWTFGYDGWLVWDGEYPDIEVGGTFEAGIEFWFVGKYALSDVNDLGTEQLGSCRYQATAKVVEVAEFVVLDLGSLLVSCHAAPMSSSSDLRVGDTIRAKIGLALNPFGYYPGSAARKKWWTVNKILCTRHVENPSLARSLGHEAEEIRAVSTQTVDSLDSCVIECTLTAAE